MSSSNVSPDVVRRLAKLARLHVDDAALPRLADDLAKILGYVAMLVTVDTSTIDATAQVTVDQLPFRPDVPHEGLSHDVALSQTARKTEAGFAVPAFVEE